MLAQFCDSCAICRLVAHCVDPQIALLDLQIAQIHRLRLTSILSHRHQSMKRNSNQSLKRCLGVMFLTIISTGTPNSKILYINHLLHINLKFFQNRLYKNVFLEYNAPFMPG